MSRACLAVSGTLRKEIFQMKMKIIIAAVLIVVVLSLLPFSIRPFDPFEEVLDHIKESGKVSTYFEKECSLRVGQKEEYKIFRIPKEDFDKLCKRLEPDGWKSEIWFTSWYTGRVWILYGKNFPSLEWMRAHEKDEKQVAADANRLIWRCRVKWVLYFLGGCVHIANHLLVNGSARKAKTAKDQKLTERVIYDLNGQKGRFDYGEYWYMRGMCNRW